LVSRAIYKFILARNASRLRVHDSVAFVTRSTRGFDSVDERISRITGKSFGAIDFDVGSSHVAVGIGDASSVRCSVFFALREIASRISSTSIKYVVCTSIGSTKSYSKIVTTTYAVVNADDLRENRTLTV
jgi:hypothetical protein